VVAARPPRSTPPSRWPEPSPSPPRSGCSQRRSRRWPWRDCGDAASPWQRLKAVTARENLCAVPAYLRRQARCRFSDGVLR